MHYIVTNLSIFVSNNLIVMLLHLQQQTYNAAEDAHYKFTYQHHLFKKFMLTGTNNIGFLNNRCC